MKENAFSTGPEFWLWSWFYNFKDILSRISLCLFNTYGSFLKDFSNSGSINVPKLVFVSLKIEREPGLVGTQMCTSWNFRSGRVLPKPSPVFILQGVRIANFSYDLIESLLKSFNWMKFCAWLLFRYGR